MYYLAFSAAMFSPLFMLVLGLRWRKHPPRRSDARLAYRTALSAKNDETWRFAHRHISKLWIRLGVLLSAASALLMFIFQADYAAFILWLIGGQMIFLCTSAFFVDILLKAAFDEEGNPSGSGADH